MADAKGTLLDLRVQGLEGYWEQFAKMPSTMFLASLIQGREDFYQVALEASRRSRLGLRIFLLAITGSLAQSYLRSRFCSECGVKFDFEYFISCPAFGDSLLPALTRLGGGQGLGKFCFGYFAPFPSFYSFLPARAV